MNSLLIIHELNFRIKYLNIFHDVKNIPLPNVIASSCKRNIPLVSGKYFHRKSICEFCAVFPRWELYPVSPKHWPDLLAEPIKYASFKNLFVHRDCKQGHFQ